MASGRLIIPLAEPILTAAGVPEPGATLTVYETGTTTLALIYSDPALTQPVANPQTSNIAGRFFEQTTVVWADSAIAYDVFLSLPNGEAFTFDEIWLLGAGQSTAGLAPINSPHFTGEPTAPTPAANSNNTDISTTAFVVRALAGLAIFPTGMLVPFAMAAVPGGWQVCDGSAISRTTFSALFGAIGVTYGAGDGSTTFNVPDYRGQFLRGLDSGAGVDPGRTLGAVQLDAMQGHYHTPLGTAAGSPFGFDVGRSSIAQNRGSPTGSGADYEATTGSPTTDTVNGTPRTARETRPTNLAAVICIKT